MSQITFTWRSQRGIGILVLICGWTLLLQLIPLYHAFHILKVGSINENWLIYLASGLIQTVLLVAFLSSTLENWSKNSLYEKGIFNIHKLVIPVMILFGLTYLWSEPFWKAIAPFINFDLIEYLEVEALFLINIILACLMVGVIWALSEMYKIEK